MGKKLQAAELVSSYHNTPTMLNEVNYFTFHITNSDVARSITHCTQNSKCLLMQSS